MTVTAGWHCPGDRDGVVVPRKASVVGATAWQCWGWQCLRAVRRCQGISSHWGGSGGCRRGDSISGSVGTFQVFQGVPAQRGSSRGFHRGVSVVSVSHRVSGMSGVVRGSSVKGIEMKDVTGVSASWGCWAVSGGCQEGVRECWGAAGGVSGCPSSLEWQKRASQGCQCPGLLRDVWVC